MPIPRRRFVQAITAASTAPVIFAQGPSASSLPKIVPGSPDQAAEPVLHFFTPTQFATLRHAASLLHPAYNTPLAPWTPRAWKSSSSLIR